MKNAELWKSKNWAITCHGDSHASLSFPSFISLVFKAICFVYNYRTGVWRTFIRIDSGSSLQAPHIPVNPTNCFLPYVTRHWCIPFYSFPEVMDVFNTLSFWLLMFWLAKTKMSLRDGVFSHNLSKQTWKTRERNGEKQGGRQIF